MELRTFVYFFLSLLGHSFLNNEVKTQGILFLWMIMELTHPSDCLGWTENIISSRNKRTLIISLIKCMCWTTVSSYWCFFCCFFFARVLCSLSLPPHVSFVGFDLLMKWRHWTLSDSKHSSQTVTDSNLNLHISFVCIDLRLYSFWKPRSCACSVLCM